MNHQDKEAVFNTGYCNVHCLDTIGDIVSKETVCCVGGKVKH